MSIKNQQLNEIQEDFLTAIRGEPSSFNNSVEPISTLSAENCIDIYARGYVARLTDTLGETFEATWWILGDEDFFELARQYIKKNPSKFFDLSEYGAGFPDFLASFKQAEEISFLHDLAKFEWTFKEIFHKRNMSTSVVDWSKSMSRGENAKFTLSSSVSLISSLFSTYEIWKVRSQPIENFGNMDWSKPEFLLVFKQNSQVFVHSLKPEEFLVVKQLAEGQTLGAAIEALVVEYKDVTPEQIQDVFLTISGLGVLTAEMEGESDP